MMPVLSPAGVQEILDYGALGWALSRYAGVWVGLKCVKDTVEFDGGRSTLRSTASLRSSRSDFRCRPAASTSAAPTASSRRKRACTRTSAPPSSPGSPPTGSTASSPPAAPTPKIGIVTAGKSYLDVRQALDELGLDEARCDALGLRLYKLACAWPIEPEGLKAFAARPRR